MRDRYLGAPEFEEMLASATKNDELWAAVWRRASVPDEFVQRVAALGGAWHLLVLSEDWCGDAVNTVPSSRGSPSSRRTPTSACWRATRIST